MNKDRPNFAVTSEEAEKSRKSTASSEEQIPDGRHHEDVSKKIPVASDASEQSRESTTYGHSMDEILNSTDPGYSTCHRDGSKDSQKDKNATLGQITSDKSHFEGINSEILDPVTTSSVTSEEGEENRKMGVSREELIPGDRHREDKSKKLPVTSETSEESNGSNDVSKQSVTHKTPTYGENTSSNMNTFQKSDRTVSDFEKLVTFKNLPLVAGPSRASENVSPLDLSVKTTKTPSKVQKVEDMENPSMHSASSTKRISDHFEVDESNHYKHSERTKEVPPKQICSFCNGWISDVNLHGIALACNFCEQSFSCRKQLHKHYFTHENYHKIYCLVCQKFIAEHRNESNIFTCCYFACMHETYNQYSFRNHILTHSLAEQFTCPFCKKGLRTKQGVVNHLEICKSKKN